MGDVSERRRHQSLSVGRELWPLWRARIEPTLRAAKKQTEEHLRKIAKTARLPRPRKSRCGTGRSATLLMGTGRLHWLSTNSELSRVRSGNSTCSSSACWKSACGEPLPNPRSQACPSLEGTIQLHRNSNGSDCLRKSLPRRLGSGIRHPQHGSQWLSINIRDCAKWR